MKNKATILFAALSLVLTVILLLQNLGVLGLLSKGGTGGSSTQRLEGNGYDSAEEALEAYIEAIRNGDVPAMLSTFAIETYIDSYDTKASLLRTGAWLPPINSEGTYEIIGSDYERQLRLFARQASIVRKVYEQLITYSAFFVEDSNSYNGLEPITFHTEEDVERFLNAYRKSSFGKALTEIKLEEFIKPEQLSEPYGSEAHLKNMKQLGNICGCDEYKSVAARITLNGESWLLTMDCGSYHGRWYNISLPGTLATLLGANVQQYGLIPYFQIQ
ncbi:MAG: hypothetical protein HFI63_04880 [Lachnospiraceae bacterium]|nr:hypothetical protein [Lachnospiraceae bacterium]